MKKEMSMVEEAKKKGKGFEFVDDGKGVVVSPKLKKILLKMRLEEEMKKKKEKKNA